ncbi:MAG: NAD(P)H nitroreductase [Bacteroidetes bacterium]|nr:MAG: NAD(P)H nitroreductase [Bacteroidota bacterium]RLD73491.1 MAG: NAD(P)H nitroreductase [Bacteroidota bacterium]RLD89006.1 MAG: NAD(P)H nitroreductase [Bacteroidota bacterium]
MKFLELITIRQSDRKYLDRPVEKEKIERCLEAARLAPSASNSQPWSFIVVDEPVLKDKVARKTFGPVKTFNKFVPQAPVIIVIVMEKPKIITEVGGRIKKKEYPLMDIGITAEHFCLQATEEGLGTCMLGWFDELAVKELLHVPESKTVPLLITLGYTPDDYKTRKKIRKSFSKLVKWNSY